MKPPSWDARIRRAEKLIERYPFSREPLSFYRALLLFQKELHAALTPELPAGPGSGAKAAFAPDVLDEQLSRLSAFFSPFLTLIEETGTEDLSRIAGRLSADAGQEEWKALLSAYWAENLDLEGDHDPVLLFFPKAFLQPLAEALAERHPARPGATPAWSVGQGSQAACPLCTRPPQLAILRPEGEGARRSLLCSLCGTEWRYKRVSCPACGQEEFSKLAHHGAEEFPQVRVDVCESCRHYVKAIDLTVDGHAVPVVDEAATLPLDLWAVEAGYRKIELNLVGM